MNRIQFLNLLSKEGYSGGEDLTAVKAFLKSKEVDTETFQDASGTTHKVDDVWAKVERKALKLATAAEDRSDLDAKVKGINSIIDSKQAPAAFIADMPIRLKKKAYNEKAKLGKTYFNDADEAEAVAASFRYLVAREKGYAQLANDEAIITKAASAFTNTGGAALVANQFVQTLVYNTEPAGVCRQLAYVVNMTSDVTNVPRKTDILSLSHRLPSGSYTETQNAYDLVNLVAKDIGGIARIPQNLIDDAAISVVDDIAATIQEARGIREDKDFINGDGSATYGGNVGLTAGLVSGAYITQGSGSTWSAQTLTDFTGLISSVENVNPDRLAFLCSRQYYANVMLRLAALPGGSSNAGGNTMREVANGLGGISNAGASFLGFPVIFSQQMPLVTGLTQKSVYFGDFMAGSMLGTRNILDIATSEHAYFTTGEIGVRVRVRGCVNICGDGRGGTYGPIVALKTS